MVMGYVFRVRMASFFAGVAVSSAWGFFLLHRDYQASHEILSKQARDLFASLDTRISQLEKLTENAASIASHDQASEQAKIEIGVEK